MPPAGLFAALPSLVAPNEFLGAHNMLLLRGVVLRPALQALGAQGDILRVVAGIDLHPRIGDLDGARRDAVEKEAVVRHDHHRAAPRRQVRLQPFERVEVKMVRGLIEQHQIGLLQQ